MALRFILKARARSSSKKKAASSKNEPIFPDGVSAYFSTLPEKDVNDYGDGRASPSPSPRLTFQDSSSKGYGYGNPASEDASKYSYGDTSLGIAYGDLAPSDCGSARPSSTRTPRRSSRKQGSTIGRSASIGCTGDIGMKLPGRSDAVRRRSSISFSEKNEMKEVERVSHHGDASHETASQYEYGDAAPSDGGSSRQVKTPRRSSMKQGSTIGRRASIGCTGEIGMNLPGQRDPAVRRRSSISFSKENEVKEVEPVSSLIDDSKALWFQNEELQDIKAKLRTIVVAVERGDENARNICIRGLECHIGRSSKTKMNAAWDAVVIEQCMQQNKGSFDDETISMKYKIFAKGSKEKAVERAKEDEAAISNYQRDTRRMMRRMSI
jgi:hypothetical protein